MQSSKKTSHSPENNNNNKDRDEVETKIPHEYICPITREVMQDPVVAADGHTYERAAITVWFCQKALTSPKTGEALSHLELTPNHALRALISDFQEESLHLQPQSIEEQLPGYVPSIKNQPTLENENEQEKQTTTMSKQEIIKQHNYVSGRDLAKSSNVFHSAAPPVKLPLPFEALMPHKFTFQLGLKELKASYANQIDFVTEAELKKEADDLFLAVKEKIKQLQSEDLVSSYSVSLENILRINTSYSDEAAELEEVFNENEITKLASKLGNNGDLVITQGDKCLNISYVKKPNILSEKEYEDKVAAALKVLQKYLKENDKDNLINNCLLEDGHLIIQTHYTDEAKELQEFLEEDRAGIKIKF